MANKDVSSDLINRFEVELVKVGKKYSQQSSDGYAFSFGYLIEMLRGGRFNEKTILERIEHFKEIS